ncbi:MAG TPA: HIT family protein [Pseudonocardiaceae bacterium]|nr:HIT family protein [Pseudonocardiaceae bacterium]
MAARNDQVSLFGTDETQVFAAQGITDAACVFCAILRGEKKATLIDESERLMSFLDHRPLFHGHVLLIPKIHIQLMSELPTDRVQEFFIEAQRLEQAVEVGLEAEGSMILINNVVSQSVPHLHLHVIPRRKKDGLRFWLGPRHPYDTEHTAELYADKIRSALASVYAQRSNEATTRQGPTFRA